jgi:uncharacterized damage-inducible protein DinB
MSIADVMLAEFEQEAKNTRLLLERVPAAKADFKPHERSYSLSDLSVHIANLPVWAVMTVNGTELDLNPPSGPGWTPPRYESPAATVDTLDENVKNATEAIAATSDTEMMVNWTLKNAGEHILTMPRVAVLRSFVFNHMIHHRGQLTVYLRMCDVPLPPIYGPTADQS